MVSANDQFSSAAELVGLLVMARFLLCSIDRYESEPDEEKWQSVCLARQWLNDSCDRAEPFRMALIDTETATQ